MTLIPPWQILVMSLSLLAVMRCEPVQAESTIDERKLSFDKTVAPILSAHCLACHRGDEPKGGLDLSDARAAWRGGASGAVIEPGRAEDSYLWQLLEADDMPPDHPISTEEKKIIRDWINSGASWGTDPIDPFAYTSSRRAGYDWWSLQPLSAPAVPQIENDEFSVNEIDRFIFAALQSNNLEPSPQADARILVRRVYVDLIGLPAPIEVVEKFAAAPSAKAWSQLVEELLASKHYGERWARHWMDVARFGESDGFEYNHPRENFWHYRDWLIRAMNADMPYDQFARMQIAGDILLPDDPEGAAAVGFLVAGTHNTVVGSSPTMKLSVRHDELEELAGTVGQSFLGLTINCARCHDHKFDPIAAREYYSFIAALDGVQHGERRFPSQTDFSVERKRIADRQDSLENRLVRLIQASRRPVSMTANLLSTKTFMPANVAGRKYRVSARFAPSVWAAESQANTDRDGIVVSVVKEDGSTLADLFVRPGGWNKGKNAKAFQDRSLEYVGDGAGKVQVHLRSFPLNSGRFGGAVDDLTVVDAASKETVFREDFNDLERPNAAGAQAHTGRRVFFGASSDRWDHSGINTIHAVEHEDGNFALQIYGGIGGTSSLEAQTPEEKQIQAELASLTMKLADLVEPAVYSVVARDPGVMRVYKRGDVGQPGQEVAPGGLAAVQVVPTSFEIDKNATDSERRLRLADWITHRENPLFHRVIVNRIWHYHFGQGLVQTPSDFGFNGGRPSHPPLLEWLSVWFRAHGYSIKELHRKIVTSATYQQASLSRPDAAKIDGNNRFLWRQNPRRIEAEVLRDSILEISGQLNPKQFGSGYRDVKIVEVPPAYYYFPVDPIGEELNRRTIYRWNVRGQRSALLDTFDCPDPSTKTPKRLVTTTPSQALSQWNDRFITRMSVMCADRIRATSSDDKEDQVATAFRLILCRPPSAFERTKASELVHRHGLPLLCRVLFNSNEFVLID